MEIASRGSQDAYAARKDHRHPKRRFVVRITQILERSTQILEFTGEPVARRDSLLAVKRATSGFTFDQEKPGMPSPRLAFYGPAAKARGRELANRHKEVPATRILRFTGHA